MHTSKTTIPLLFCYYSSCKIMWSPGGQGNKSECIDKKQAGAAWEGDTQSRARHRQSAVAPDPSPWYCFSASQAAPACFSVLGWWPCLVHLPAPACCLWKGMMKAERDSTWLEKGTNKVSNTLLDHEKMNFSRLPWGQQRFFSSSLLWLFPIGNTSKLHKPSTLGCSCWIPVGFFFFEN